MSDLETGSSDFIIHSGWRRIFRIAYFKYPLETLWVFITGAIATALDMAAFAVIVIAVSYLSAGGELSLFGYNVAGENQSVNLMYFVAAFGVLKLSGTFMSYWNMMMVANFRVMTFKDVIRETVARIRDFPQHPYVQKYGIKYLPRVLRRETRYTARAISDAFQLPRHVVIVIILLVVGVLYFPLPLFVVVAVIAVSIPFHVMAGRWGARAMNDLIVSGIKKGIFDRRVILRILQSPFSSSAKFNNRVEHEHVENETVLRFLNAYGKRAKLAPVSQLVSSLSFLIIFILLSFILLSDVLDGTREAPEVIALVFGIRFLASSSSVIAQIVTNIASYSPLVSELLDFLYKSPDDFDEVPLVLNDPDIMLSKRVVLIGKSTIDVNLTRKLHQLWKAEGEPISMLHSDVAMLPKEDSKGIVQEALDTDWSDLSDALKANIMEAFEKSGKQYAVANHLIMLWLASRQSPKSPVLWEGRGFIGMLPRDREKILNWLRNRKVIIYYGGVPKRLPDLNRYMVWVLNENRIFQLGRTSNFLSFRDEAIEIFNRTSKIDDETADIDQFDDDDMI